MEFMELSPEVRKTKPAFKIKKSFIIGKLKHYLYNAHDPIGVKLMSSLRLQFTRSNEHKFRHGFNDTVNPMCLYGIDIETTANFLLRCYCFSTKRSQDINNLYISL